MLQLEHTLSRIAFQPSKRANPLYKSGAARRKYAQLRKTVGDFIGSDIIQALVPEPHIVATLGALKVAALTYMLDCFVDAAATP